MSLRALAGNRYRSGHLLRAADDYLLLLIPYPVMGGAAFRCVLLVLHQPGPCFGRSGFETVGGAISAINDLGRIVPALAARQFDYESQSSIVLRPSNGKPATSW